MKRTINAIVIHCSATPNGKEAHASDIDKMHEARGFKRDRQATRNFNPDLPHIGYHFFITVDGTLETGRHIEEIGAHVQGSNSHSIGVCMAGLDKFTPAQWECLQNCIIGLTSRISGVQITSPTHCTTLLHDMGIALKGHRDYSPDLNGDGIIQRTEWIKNCPNFDVREWVRGGMVEIKAATFYER
jgi:N-acetylmuramoyl-L-alanine amidase